ncbi:MAG: alanine racemase [Paracoccaceae bacterium]|nr:alanine racemase [Paracoccaceae bacterium]
MTNGLNSIESFFRLDAAPPDPADLETPVPIVNLDVVENNLRRWQARCDQLGLKNRPHVKTHKMTALARFQLAVGASGITVQKLGEAEVMAGAGISDILVTFNIVNRAKLERLAELSRTARVSVVADNAVVIEGIAWAASAAGRRIGVLVECDTGGGRNGVQSPDEAAALARQISGSPYLDCAGLMTFPAPGGRQPMAAFLAEAKSLMDGADCVSVGGTPDMWSDDGLWVATEYRAGTYIFNDLSTITAGASTESDCAVDILSTVVSRPTADRAIVDAGSKALTSDQLGETGFGRVRGGRSRLYALTEEHGLLDTRDFERRLDVGDIVRIIPNHICPVINLFDKVAVSKGGIVLGLATVDARGRVA